MIKNPDKMSQRELRAEVKLLRERAEAESKAIGLVLAMKAHIVDVISLAEELTVECEKISTER